MMVDLYVFSLLSLKLSLVQFLSLIDGIGDLHFGGLFFLFVFVILECLFMLFFWGFSLFVSIAAGLLLIRTFWIMFSFLKQVFLCSIIGMEVEWGSPNYCLEVNSPFNFIHIVKKNVFYRVKRSGKERD